MSDAKKPLGITDVVLRDAHQSLFATRMRVEDMLPIAEKLDKVGYWSLESWGGAIFDSCIRFIGEDPWERIRLLKQAMPNTKQQMLLRGHPVTDADLAVREPEAFAHLAERAREARGAATS